MLDKHTIYTSDIANAVSALSVFGLFGGKFKVYKKKSHLIFNGILIGKLKPLQPLNTLPLFFPIVPHFLLFSSLDDVGIRYEQNLLQIFVKLVWITQQCLVRLFLWKGTEPSGKNGYGVWQGAGAWIKWTLCWCGLASISAHLTMIAGWTWLP